MEFRPFAPEYSAVSLDTSVLLRRSGLDVVRGDALVFGPFNGGPLTYSRPLPTLIVFGASRHSMIWFKTRMVRSVGFSRFSRLRGLIRRFSSNLILTR